MTGFLTLNADPTASGHAATKQYVDAQAGGSLTAYSGYAEGAFVNVSGDTMTGSLAITSGVVSVKSHGGYAGSDYTVVTAAVQTTDNSTVTAHTLPLEEGYAYIFESLVVGRKASGGTFRIRAEINRGCTYRNVGGSAVLVSTVDNTLSRSLSAGGYDIVVNVSGNDLIVTVNGDAGETVNWVSTLRYQKIGSNL
jgi:hypothetical protein